MRIIDAGAKMMYGNSPTPWRKKNDHTKRYPVMPGGDAGLAADASTLAFVGARVEAAAKETTSKTTKTNAERQEAKSI
jgi:hypothetical protein